MIAKWFNKVFKSRKWCLQFSCLFVSEIVFSKWRFVPGSRFEWQNAVVFAWIMRNLCFSRWDINEHRSFSTTKINLMNSYLLPNYRRKIESHTFKQILAYLFVVVVVSFLFKGLHIKLTRFIWSLRLTPGLFLIVMVQSPSPGGPRDVFCRPARAWRWGMSFFHIHSTVIQNEKQKILTEKPVFQTLSCLVGRVCVFPPYGIWGGIAIYVRECAGPFQIAAEWSVNYQQGFIFLSLSFFSSTLSSLRRSFLWGPQCIWPWFRGKSSWCNKCWPPSLSSMQHLAGHLTYSWRWWWKRFQVALHIIAP